MRSCSSLQFIGIRAAAGLNPAYNTLFLDSNACPGMRV